MIPHSRPQFDTPSYQQAVLKLLQSAYTACGDDVAALQTVLARDVQQVSAIAVDSGTSALMLALRSLSCQQMIRRVGIPAYACASLLFAVKAAGCVPVCMDCDDDLRLNAQAAKALAASLDAVILVHPFGMIEPLLKASWPCPVIEDIAQAAGAVLDDQPVGSFGDLSIASFYATKVWGGAYGGMVFGSEQHCQWIREISNPDQASLDQPYVGHHLLSNVHASLAACRVEQSADELQQRLRRMAWLDEHLPKRLRDSVKHRSEGNAFRYIIRVEHADTCIAKLKKVGIAAAKPVQQALHHTTGDQCEGAERAMQHCVSLPLLAFMSAEEEWHYAAGLKLCLPS